MKAFKQGGLFLEPLEVVGGLEVWFMGVLLFSKKKSGVWPNNTALA